MNVYVPISVTLTVCLCMLKLFLYLKQGLIGWAWLAPNCNRLPQTLKCYNYRQVPPCCTYTFLVFFLHYLVTLPPFNFWLKI